jgi:ATP-dependent Clp protease ATP-binding subunit ClpA
VAKFLAELEQQLLAKRVTLEVSDAARHWLAEKGHDRVFGARPLGRVIQAELSGRLVDEMLFGQLEHGGVARIDLAQGKLAFDFRPRS